MKTCCYEKCIRAGEVLPALGPRRVAGERGAVSPRVPAVVDEPSASPAGQLLPQSSVAISAHHSTTLPCAALPSPCPLFAVALYCF